MSLIDHELYLISNQKTVILSFQGENAKELKLSKIGGVLLPCIKFFSWFLWLFTGGNIYYNTLFKWIYIKTTWDIPGHPNS